MKRLRCKYTKGEEVKFISHLDLLRVIQRALRRADIKVALTQGFNPHPRISFGPALIVGATTEGDYMDIDLEEDISPEEFKRKMNEVLPAGIKITEVFEVDIKDSLSSRIKEADYLLEVFLKKQMEDLGEAVKRFLTQDAIEIEKDTKKGKKLIDLKSYLEEFYLIDTNKEKAKFYVKMKLGEGAPNPLHLLKAFDEYLGNAFNLEYYRIHRKNIFLE
ncbi:MAG: TIGR03936 family radical SAM-associated protein [Caldanaerobacter sp.]